MIDALPASLPLLLLPLPVTHSLLCHPSGTDTSVHAIQASANWLANGALQLSYRIYGHPADILLPTEQSPGSADELWRHTCCEAFIATVNQKNYREFNLSPSNQSANYHFLDYRQRDMTFQPAAQPIIDFQRCDDGFQLDAVLDKALLPSGNSLQLGLAVIIESTAGRKTCWALTHCATQPDFHRRQSFTLTLHSANP